MDNTSLSKETFHVVPKVSVAPAGNGCSNQMSMDRASDGNASDDSVLPKLVYETEDESYYCDMQMDNTSLSEETFNVVPKVPVPSCGDGCSNRVGTMVTDPSEVTTISID